ncbi:MAG: hypothetical protein HRT89_24425 [Lentisphaeria bacterium]|nr:hypothetical protein [Lentisphaeria bacterium]NQZ71203.1 hypothetical protein [Lentisphaeria bacterium]
MARRLTKASEKRKLLKQIADVELDLTMQLLKARWEVGRLVNSLYEAEGHRYGTGFVEEAADSLGVSERAVYDMLKCYRTYNSFGDLETLGVPWSIVKNLLMVPTKTKRKKLASRIKNESLSVKEAKILIAKS